MKTNVKIREHRADPLRGIREHATAHTWGQLQRGEEELRLLAFDGYEMAAKYREVEA